MNSHIRASRPVAASSADRRAVAPTSRKPGRAEEIIDAAARVFAVRGYHGASTQDIADLLGIRQASLYYHVPSKEAALEIVCLKGVEGHYEAASAIARREGSARERLRALIFAHLDQLSDRGDYVRVFLNERHHLPPQSRGRIGRTARRIERIFESVIRQGIRSGEFRRGADPRLATLGVLGLLNSVPQWFRKEAKPLAIVADQIAALALGGLGRVGRT
jgi:TetR/AcrR family transcriptional regulator, cholesterol catabolism regulator